MIETKVKAGTAAGGVTGLVVWALVTFVFKNGLPQPVMDALPFILAGHTIAAYLAPHTHRATPAAAPATLAGKR